MQTNTNEICIQILKELVAINTCNPPGNEAHLVTTILKITKPPADSYKLLPIEEGRCNLIIELKGKSKLIIGFAGHLDTVPVGEPSAWTFPPFAGQIKNGYLYGRGASDMRGGLTSMLLLYLYYKNNHIIPPVTLRFLFTVDEEVGGTGISAFFQQGWLKDLSQLFICEPTNCQPGSAEKGALWIEALFKGESSHAANPLKGINSLEYGLKYMQHLKTIIEALPSHPFLGSCTCAITKATAGIKTNIIPDKAEFAADIRLVPDISNTKIINLAKDEALNLKNAHPGLDITLTFTNNREALQTATNSPLLKKLKNVYQSLQLPFVPTGICFYTDASLVIPFMKIPFIILGPGEQSECHCVNEKVQISSVLRAFELYRAYIET